MPLPARGFRLRVWMALVVLAAVAMGVVSEVSRTRRRWSSYERSARQHFQREVVYRRLATRFEELARVESDRAESLDPRHDRTEIEQHRVTAESLREEANACTLNADAEGRRAREDLTRW